MIGVEIKIVIENTVCDDAGVGPGGDEMSLCHVR
jgi:hypothetical protein